MLTADFCLGPSASQLGSESATEQLQQLLLKVKQLEKQLEDKNSANAMANPESSNAVANPRSSDAVANPKSSDAVANPESSQALVKPASQVARDNRPVATPARTKEHVFQEPAELPKMMPDGLPPKVNSTTHRNEWAAMVACQL